MCKFSGPTPDLLNQKLSVSDPGLCLNKLPTWFWYSPRFWELLTDWIIFKSSTIYTANIRETKPGRSKYQNETSYASAHRHVTLKRVTHTIQIKLCEAPPYLKATPGQMVGVHGRRTHCLPLKWYSGPLHQRKTAGIHWDTVQPRSPGTRRIIFLLDFSKGT